MATKIVYKRIVAVIFLAAFFAQIFGRGFLIADYYANTSKYAKNCVNKARPKLHCNGKCQLMKKLQEEEKKDQENQERRAENKNEISLTDKTYFTTIEPYSSYYHLSVSFAYSKAFILHGHLSGVFRPPCA